MRTEQQVTDFPDTRGGNFKKMDLKSTVDLQTHNGSGVARGRYKEKRLNDEEDERVGSKDRLKEGEGEKRETIKNTMCFPRPRGQIQQTWGGRLSPLSPSVSCECLDGLALIFSTRPFPTFSAQRGIYFPLSFFTKGSEEMMIFLVDEILSFF